MTIKLNIPEVTKAAVITLLADYGMTFKMITKTICTNEIKDGAEYDLIPELPKEGDSE